MANGRQSLELRAQNEVERGRILPVEAGMEFIFVAQENVLQ